MTKPIRPIRKRTTAPLGAPEQLAEHFCTAGEFWPTDEDAGWAALRPRSDDWTPAVSGIVRRRVSRRAFEMLEREYADGPCRPFADWPREQLHELHDLVCRLRKDDSRRSRPGDGETV